MKTKIQNYFIVYGCEPKAQVALKTQMLPDLFENMRHKMSVTNYLELPKDLQQINSKDVSFEFFATSNSQKVVLYNKNSPYALKSNQKKRRTS